MSNTPTTSDKKTSGAASENGAYNYTYDKPHVGVYYTLGAVCVAIIPALILANYLSPFTLQHLPTFLLLASVALASNLLGRRIHGTIVITTIDQFQNLSSIFCGPLYGTAIGLAGMCLIPRVFRYRWIALVHFCTIVAAGLISWFTFTGLQALVDRWDIAQGARPALTVLAFLISGFMHTLTWNLITRVTFHVSRSVQHNPGDHPSSLVMLLLDVSMTPPTSLVCCIWYANPALGLLLSCTLIPIAATYQKAFSTVIQSDITHHRVLRNIALYSQFELTPEHTQHRIARAQAICRHIATALGSNHRQILELEHAVELHDIGRIAVAPEVRRRPLAAARDGSEFSHAHLRYHLNGYRALDNVSTVSDDVRAIIRHHHDRYDGCHAPHGLKGADIPLDARILHTANTYIALTTPSPHYAHLEPRAALEYMNTHLAGTQLCPRTIAALAQSFSTALPWALPVLHPAPTRDEQLEAISFASKESAATYAAKAASPPALSHWLQGLISARDDVYRRSSLRRELPTPPYAHDAWLEHDLPEVSALLAGLPAEHLRLPDSTLPPGTFDTMPHGYLMLENHREPHVPPSHDLTTVGEPLVAGAPSTPPLPPNPYRPRVKRFRVRPTQ